MKKFKNVVLILALFMCFNGCEKNPISEEQMQHNEQFTIEQAQAWFGGEWTGSLSLKSGNVEKDRIGIRPDWCDGFTSHNNEVEAVEVRLLVQGSFGFAEEDSYKDWQKTKNPNMIRSLTRMVFLKYKKDGRIDQFLMTIIGDKEYHNKKDGQLDDNSYLTREKHFSGYIFYHDLTGNFVNGWKYANGKILGTCSQTGENNAPLVLKSAVCTEITATLYSQHCTAWFIQGQYSYTSCNSPVSEVLFSYVYCLTNSSAGADGGTPGGYNPPVQPCTCTNKCATCGKCIGNALKSAIVPGGGTTTTTPTTDPCTYCAGHPVPVIELTDKFENNQKVMCVYSKLIQTAARSFNPLVNSFLANFSEGVTINPGDITFDLGSMDGASGQCTSAGDNFTVILNENLISTRPSIEMARTLIHEILHAQIGHSLQISLGSFVSNFGQYTSTKKGILYTDQHLLMMENYVQPMANFLKNFDSLNGYSADDSYYRGLALCGLMDLINLTSSEFDEIIRAQDYFRNRGLNCQ